LLRRIYHGLSAPSYPLLETAAHVFRNMERPKRNLSLFLFAVVVCASLAATTLAKPHFQGCSSPKVQLYEESDRCEGDFDAGPFFDGNACPGECSAVPNGQYSVSYQCGSQEGLEMSTSFTPSCNGPTSHLKVQTGRCSRLAGSSTSFAITCKENEPILPPLTEQTPSWGNGTFLPAFSQCQSIDNCPPNMPYHTVWDLPNCQGKATSTPFSNNARLDGCYLVPWPINLNFRMTCPSKTNLQFQVATSCDTKPFITLTYPTGVCINNANGYGSSMYHCNDQPSFNSHAYSKVMHQENLAFKDAAHTLKIKNSIGDVLKQHPLSKHNPILQRLIKTGI